MNIAKEIKKFVEVKVDINEKAIADVVYNKVAEPLVQKVLKLIPTEIDDAWYEANKAKLKEDFYELVADGVEQVEDKIEE